MLIDMDKDREALGLPSNAPILTPGIKTVLAAFLVVALSAMAGFGASYLYRIHQSYVLAQLETKLGKAISPQEQAALVLQIRDQAPDNTFGRYMAGHYLESIANSQRYPREWQSAALHEYQTALQMGFDDLSFTSWSLTNPEEPNLSRKEKEEIAQERFEFLLKMRCAGLLLDNGKGKEALEMAEGISLKSVNAFSPLVEENKNLIAYILSSTDDPKVRDSSRALQIIRNVVRRNRYNVQPAFIDTLAESYYADGQPQKAVIAQKWALANAPSPLHWVYIDHYRKYLKAAQQTKGQNDQTGK